MRRQLLWVAAAVALAAGLLPNATQALAQQAASSAEATTDTGQATQPTDSASADAAGQADAQSSAAQTGSPNGAATDQAATGQANTSTDGASSSASGTQSSQTGTTVPPPDASAQPQGQAAQTQDDATQSQPAQPQAASSQNQQQNQQEVNRNQTVQGANGALDASAQGQTDVRAGGRDRDFRDRSSRDFNIGIRFGVPTGRGLVIDTIDRNSVFFDSGLHRGDVLISLHGQPVRSQAEFVRWVHTHPGQRIPVVVLRDGRQQTVYITYDQQMMPQDRQVYRPVEPQVVGSQAFLGVMFDPQVFDAAIVRSVSPGSPAEHAGLRQGDMITALNGQRVSSYQHAIQLIRVMQPGDQLMIDFSRRVTDQTQALLADRPGESVRTATAPDLRYEQEVAPMPQPVYQDRPGDVPPGEFDRDPRMIDRERGVRPALRDRPLLPRLRN